MSQSPISYLGSLMDSAIIASDPVRAFPSLERAPQPTATCTKRSYATKREAETARNARLTGTGRPESLRLYLCNRCGTWHMTHQTKRSTS